MSGRGPWVVAAVAVASSLSALGISSAGGDERPAAKAAHAAAPTLAIARFGGDGIRGVVYAARRPGTRRVYMGVSLHGLTAGRTYEVRGVTRPCSRALEGDAIGRATVLRTTTPWEVEDFGEFQSDDPSPPLGRIRSFRVYEREQEAELRQRACARDAVFIGAGAATGAIIGR